VGNTLRSRIERVFLNDLSNLESSFVHKDQVDSLVNDRS